MMSEPNSKRKPLSLSESEEGRNPSDINESNKGRAEMATTQDRVAVRMLVKAREDFQGMRKRMDNRIGRKADGKAQDIEERMFSTADVANFESVADAAKKQEKEIEKMLLKALKRFPIYTEWLSTVKGIGPISAGWIIGEYDIHIASTVSKMWQFTGLNPNKVRGKKRKENDDGSFEYTVTDTMIHGDKLSAGFVAPFNKRLRTALLGVMADGFIRAQNSYALDYYYPYKLRLENSEKETITSRGNKAEKEMMWSEVSKGHRDRAAKRYMLKMFLKDLYAKWREVEDLEVRVPYQEEYLGHKHEAA